MTAIGASANESAQSGAAQITSPAEVEVVEAVAVEAPATGLMAGDPMALGLPTFIVGSVALGLTLVGMVPAAAVGAPLAIILAATSIGLFVATIWAAVLGQSAVASTPSLSSQGLSVGQRTVTGSRAATRPAAPR